jgi:hypothetical protein
VTAIILRRCNAYGAENVSGGVNLGGLDSQPVAIQNVCRNEAVHRFRWVCEHGHASGVPFLLCKQHFLEFTGSPLVPWNVRRDVHFCPRCNAKSDHKCKVRLIPVS